MIQNKIDAHQHFWHFDPVRDSWITPDMAVIQHDFLPPDLEPHLDESGFAGCIAVQANQSEEENAFLLALAEKHAFIKGVVGWVDLRAENLSDRLSYYKQYPKMKGFRHVLQGEPQRDLMLQPSFMKGIAALKGFGFTYDILIFEDQLSYTADFVAAFPDQPFVIDHLAKPTIKEGRITEWKQRMAAVAQHENVCCKLSGMVTEADWKAWRQDDFTPYLDAVTELFGTDRMMFGSDWPVCLVAGSYRETVGIVEDYFSSFSLTEKEKIFGENARRFYQL